MIKEYLSRFLTTIKQLSKNKLILNMILVGGISLLVKAISFLKETLIASNFGLSELLDTYYIAILIPSFIQNVFIGALRGLFIPNYITEIKTTNKKESFQSLIFLSITIIVILFTILALIFSEFFLEDVFPNHSVEYYNLIRIQLYYVLPCLFLWGVNGLFNGLLEIKNKFLASTLSQVIIPVTIIVTLVLFKDFFGDKILVVSMLAGSLLSFIYLYISCLYHRVFKLGPLRLNRNMQIMLKQYPPKVISGLLTGINPFVDQFFAAQLVIGSIAAINYGMKIPAFMIGIIMLAVGNVLLPHFSRLVNTDLHKAYLQLFKILKIVFIGSLVIAVFTIIFSNNIVQLLFERNEFTTDDTFVVSNIQKIALVYVPFYLCTLVCVNFLTAINKNKFMAWTSFWNLLLNLTMNFILVREFGVYGLVLSTTIVYMVASFIYVGFSYLQFKKYLMLKI